MTNRYINETFIVYDKWRDDIYIQFSAYFNLIILGHHFFPFSSPIHLSYAHISLSLQFQPNKKFTKLDLAYSSTLHKTFHR